MFKQSLIIGIAAAGLLLSAQASAYQSGHSHKVTKKSSHSQSYKAKPRKRYAPRFNVNREQRQQAIMIKQGIKTCRITPREARVLNKQQSKIKKTERRLRKSGLTRWETSHLKNRLHTARVQINSFTKNRNTCGRSKSRYNKGKSQYKSQRNSYKSQGNSFTVYNRGHR